MMPFYGSYPISGKWVCIWPGFRQVYETFNLAKNDMLDMLWFWGHDYVDANPELYAEIMKAWEDIAKADDIGYTQRMNYFYTHVGGEKFILVRYSEEKNYVGVRDQLQIEAGEGEASDEAKP